MCRAIAAESWNLYSANSWTRTRNIWFPSADREQLSYVTLIKLAHKSCKDTFFKDFYLNSQLLIPGTPVESKSLLTPGVSTTYQSFGLCKSSRQSRQYKSKQAERKRIICNKYRSTKGKLDHLQNILIKRMTNGWWDL